MRCEQCNKFVSYDEPEVEVNSVDVEDNSVRYSVRVVLKCQDCGSELKDAEIESEQPFEHECKSAGVKDSDYKKSKAQFEITDEGSGEGTNRLQDKDRHGKQIKAMRYMKAFYGFQLDPTVHCKKCGEDFTVTVEGEEQASAFNELC